MTGPRVDHLDAAQRAAEAHLAACSAAEWAYEETGDLAELAASPATGSGCMGCDTCTVREVLAAAWPHALAYGADLIVERFPHADPALAAAVELLRAEAQRMALPPAPARPDTDSEGVDA